MPPTLKMATAKLHTMVVAPSLKGSPDLSLDTFLKKLRNFCQTPEEGEKIRRGNFKESLGLLHFITKNHDQQM